MLDNRFKVRRRIAKVQFISLLVTLASCLLIAGFGDEQTSKNLHEAGIIIAPIILGFTANIAHYFHLVSQADALQA